MTQTMTRYRALLERLLQGRDGGSLTQQREDAMLDEMDELWWKMTEDERKSLDALA